jgi:hypothetical protein
MARKKKKKKIKEICNNCRLCDHERGLCKVTVMINGEKFNMPVFPDDKCHMEELGVEIKEIRWWQEDPTTGKATDKDGIVKMEYPDDLKLWNGFFEEKPKLWDK